VGNLSTFQHALRDVEAVLKQYSDSGRIKTWSPTEFGFVIAEYITTPRTTVPKQEGIALWIKVMADETIQIATGVLVRKSPGEHVGDSPSAYTSAVVASDAVSATTERLLGAIIGYLN
jgi:hypothetical protein